MSGRPMSGRLVNGRSVSGRSVTGRPMTGQSLIRRLRDADAQAYALVARTPTPGPVDMLLRKLSRTANHSKISFTVAAVLAIRPGRPRLAAATGAGAVGVASVTANLLAKRLARRPRPPRAEPGRFPRRYVAMPRSASFPSGHTASAVAFAVAVGKVLPAAAAPLGALAALVGYSRVHTGVHYPGDVAGGAVLGAASAAVALKAGSRMTQRSDRG